MSHYNPFIASWTQSPPGSATNPHNFPKCCILHSDLWFSWQIRKKKRGGEKKVQEGSESVQLCACRCWAVIAAIPTQTHPVVLLLHVPPTLWRSHGGRDEPQEVAEIGVALMLAGPSQEVSVGVASRCCAGAGCSFVPGVPGNAWSWYYWEHFPGRN